MGNANFRWKLPILFLCLVCLFPGFASAADEGVDAIRSTGSREMSLLEIKGQLQDVLKQTDLLRESLQRNMADLDREIEACKECPEEEWRALAEKRGRFEAQLRILDEKRGQLKQLLKDLSKGSDTHRMESGAR